MPPERTPKRARATTRTTIRKRASNPKRIRISGPEAKRWTLGALVDDYLEKHRLCVEAGRSWDRAKRDDPDSVQANDRLEDFTKAHNARAAAFRALREARQGKPKPEPGSIEPLFATLPDRRRYP